MTSARSHRSHCQTPGLNQDPLASSSVPCGYRKKSPHTGGLKQQKGVLSDSGGCKSGSKVSARLWGRSFLACPSFRWPQRSLGCGHSTDLCLSSHGLLLICAYEDTCHVILDTAVRGRLSLLEPNPADRVESHMIIYSNSAGGRGRSVGHAQNAAPRHFISNEGI